VSSPDPLQLSLKVLKQFRIIYGSVRHHFRQVESACGVSGSQLWLLQEVARTPGIGVSELAEKLSIHQSTCSQMVEKLAQRGLLAKERSKADQRRVGLHLGEQASALLTAAPGPAQGVLPEALAALPEVDLQALQAQLEKVIAQLQMRDETFGDKPLADL